MQRYLAEKYMSGPKADAILARDQAAKKKKRKQATSNNTSNSSGNIAIVDDDAGWVCPIKVNTDDEDDVKKAVVASDQSFKKRRVARMAAGYHYRLNVKNKRKR